MELSRFQKIIIIMDLILNLFISIEAKQMKILFITHADFETPGVIETWAREKKYEVSMLKPYREESCKPNDDFDFLIIMGGPQSACDLDKYPYLFDEIKLIKKAIEQDKIVLGFCLGAQLIGEALGAKTERSPEKEIGVFPIILTSDALTDPILKDFPKVFPAIHWHSDMPGQTKDSILLAGSAGCPRQILRYRNKVYGFQCHLEITKAGIEAMVAACPEDLVLSMYTQTKQELLANDYNLINKFMIIILERLIYNDI
jgi:GMP synthase (glutamine-hydrolysing)